jgi:sugar/nucleoside kinase (ribokinase family)
MTKSIDCIVCGSCVVDVLVHPFPLETPVGGGKLIKTDPIEVTTGGIVSNAGVALARLGMKAAAFSYVGDDQWSSVIRERYDREGINTAGLQTHATAATSTTAVLIDPSGERSFAHCVGAPKFMTKQTFLDNLDLFSRSRMMLLGYYSLMPNLESDLPEIFSAIRARGCMTALDCAGEGGGMQPLDRILPHLDIYVPSRAEATHQTSESDPQRIIQRYRACGAPGVLGVKLGAEGALLSLKDGEFHEIRQVDPPGELVDTTGAGDCFYAGLLAGLLRGMPVEQAGRLGAATGACCVTAIGASAGLRNYDETLRLAGITDAGITDSGHG